MAEISIVPNPDVLDDQNIGAPDNPWTNVYTDKIYTTIIKLPRLLSNDPPSALNRIDSIHLRSAGLYIGEQRLMMESDLSPLLLKMEALFSVFADGGVHGHYPHIPAGYDTYASLIEHVQNLEQGVGSVFATTVAQLGVDLQSLTNNFNAYVATDAIRQQLNLENLNVAPNFISNTLYVLNNALYFNGSPIAAANLANAKLSDIGDVIYTNPSVGQGLVWQAATANTVSHWAPGQITAGTLVGSLDDLSDVKASNGNSPNDGEALIYSANSQLWVPGSVTSNLNSLTDVSLSTLSSGQVITTDGTNWSNKTLNIYDMSDVKTDGPNAPSDGNVLTWNDNSSAWIASAPSGGSNVTELDDLSDVTITSSAFSGILHYSNSLGYFKNSASLEITNAGHLLPASNASYDIGSAEKKIRHLYLSNNSLFVGDVKVSSDSNTGALSFGLSSSSTLNAISSVNYVDNEVTTLNSSISGVDNKITSTNNTVSTLNTTVTNLSSTINSISGTINTLSANLTSLETSVNSVETTANTLQAQVNANIADISAVEGDIVTLNATVTTLTTAGSSNASEITALVNRVDSVSSAVTGSTIDSYPTLTGTSYLNSSTSVHGATLLLDAALNSTDGIVAGHTTSITSLTSSLNSKQDSFSVGTGLTLSGSTLNIGDLSAQIAGFADSISNHDTDNLSEGSSNLYHTDARSRASISVTDSGGDGSLSYDYTSGVISYTGPSATETRAHFSAGTGVTVTNGAIAISQSVGTTDEVSFSKVTAPLTGNVTGTVSDLSNHDTDSLTEGSNNLYYTEARSRSALSVTDSGGDGSLSYNNTTGAITYVGPSATETRAHFSSGTGVSITNGTLSIGQSVGTTDEVSFSKVTANLTGNVTGTVSDLSNHDTDDVSEGSSNLYFTQSRSRSSISITDNGGDGSLTYSSADGVISYTGPSATETRAHFSGGTGLTITNGTLSIGQSVGTTDDVEFNNLTLLGNLVVNGSTTTVATTNTQVSDTLIELGNGTTGTPANDAGIVIERGDADNAFIGFDESSNKFIVGTGSFTGSSTGNLTISTGTLVADIEGNLIGNVTGTVSSLANHNTDNVSEGSTNQYYTVARAREAITVTDSGGDGSLSYNDNTGSITYIGPSAAETRAHFSGGTGVTVTDGSIAIGQSVGTTDNVQFNTVTADITGTVSSLANHDTDDVSEGSSNLYYTDARSRSSISITDSGGDGSLAYNSTTGVVTYTGPSASETRAHFSSGTGVSITEGTIAIGQSVGTTDDVQFNSVTADLSGNVTGTVSSLANHDTDDISEGSSNLYYTDARSRASISITDSGGDGSLAYNSGTGAITYTGPSASETRAHFSAGNNISITNGVIATASTLSANLTGNVTGTVSSLSNHDTDDVSEGSSNLYHTDARSRASISVTDSGGDGSLAYNSSTGAITYTGPSATETRAHFSAGTNISITDGEIATTSTLVANLTGNVTGTVSSLANHDTDDVSEGNSNLYYTDARARNSVSVTDSGGDGSLSYNSTSGVLTYTGPSSSEVRAHISAGTNVSITDGEISFASVLQNLVISGHILETFDHGSISSSHGSATDLGSVSSTTIHNATDLGGLDNGSFI